MAGNMCVLLKTPFCLEFCGWKCVFSAENSVLFGILWLEICVFSAENAVLFGILWLEICVFC